MENRERLVSRAQDYYLEKHRELQRQEDDIEDGAGREAAAVSRLVPFCPSQSVFKPSRPLEKSMMNLGNGHLTAGYSRR